MLDLYAEYGYAVIFVPVFLETAGLPLPGETSLLLAGVASSTGRIDVFWAIVVGATAAILGDNVGYAIGRFGGRPLVMRLAHIGGIERSLAWGEDYFARQGRHHRLLRPLDPRPAHLRCVDRGDGAHVVVEVRALERRRRHLLGDVDRAARPLLRQLDPRRRAGARASAA